MESRTSPGRGLAFALLAGLTAPPLQAVGQEAASLGEPLVRAAEPFSDIAGIRELSDGSLLVSDGLEGRLLRVSPDLSQSRPIGREGAGPGEYRTPDALFAMAADSTLMIDLGNGRLAVLDPEGTIVRTTPMASGEGPRMQIMLPAGVDRVGRVFFRPLGGMRGGIPDSATIQVFDPGSKSTRDIARVKRPDMQEESSGGANNQNRVIRPIPLSREDVWTAAPDGSVAIARSDAGSYWLEIVGQENSRAGPRVDYRPVPVKSADKEEWIQSLSGALGVGIEVENGRRRTTFSRGGRGGAPDPDEFEWPEEKPAFPASGLSAAPDDRFWLRIHMPAGERPRYDVFDEAGRRLGSVTLPEGRRLEGFGRDTVYLSRTDDLDFVWLERYASPGL